MLVGGTNLDEPDFAPGLPVYPELPQFCRVTGPASPGLGDNVYQAFIQQWTPPLTLRDREPCFVWEPNNIFLTPGYYDCRLVGSLSGEPLLATNCCSGSGGSLTSASSLSLASQSSTPFPPQFVNLRVWLKADAIMGLVDDDPVATWIDSSGYGNDATQATSSKRPTYKTGIQNGLPAVRFDATDDGMVTPLVIAALPVTAIVVYIIRGEAGAARCAIQGSVQDWFIGPYNFFHRYNNGESIVGPVIFGDTGVAHAHMSIQRPSLDYGEYFFDRASQGNNDHNNVPGTVGLGTEGFYTNAYLDGDILEAAVYDVELTSDERDVWWDYLSAKWNLGI